MPAKPHPRYHKTKGYWYLVRNGKQKFLAHDEQTARERFRTNLAVGGKAPKVPMDHARHTDVNLTMQRYSHTVLDDRAKAIHVLLDLSAGHEQEALRATGTGDAESINTVDKRSNLSEC